MRRWELTFFFINMSEHDSEYHFTVGQSQFSPWILFHKYEFCNRMGHGDHASFIASLLQPINADYSSSLARVTTRPTRVGSGQIYHPWVLHSQNPGTTSLCECQAIDDFSFDIFFSSSSILFSSYIHAIRFPLEQSRPLSYGTTPTDTTCHERERYRRLNCSKRRLQQLYALRHLLEGCSFWIEFRSLTELQK